MATIDRASSSASSPQSSPSPSPSMREEREAIAEDTLFVAVSRQVADSKSVLLWALENHGDSQICIIHVHLPDKEISIGIGVPVHIDQIDNKGQIEAHRVKERKKLSKKLDEHLKICSKHGVTARKIYIEMDSIQDGIVKLISDKKIEKLVMGGASDQKFSEGMLDIVSGKAKYVRQHAPGYCGIWFICRKLLIHTREATENFGRLKPAPSYEIGRLLDPQRRFVGNRSFSHSSMPGPSAPESIIENSHLYYAMEQLERRLESAMEQAENSKKERDNAIKQVEQVRRQLMEGVSCVDFPTFCYELPLQEIDKATSKFDPLLKIGEDAYGNIYKGFFNLKVAVKIPNPSSSSSPQQFQQEVEFMSKLRHPNIVNLISICPESQVLIHEYCANGNLEDQLSSNVEGSPLLWQTRLRIAIELCIVLMFLHSQKPQPIIHGDIRAENIHLDSKYTCKLNDFRASIAISSGTFSLENILPISYAYIDPEYFSAGELTTRSDVYSYGIILLRLLTGKQAVRITRQVQIAVDTDELGALLDTSAGWPLEQAKRLAALALRCCEMRSCQRLDLEPDVWNVLESMKGLCD